MEFLNNYNNHVINCSNLHSINTNRFNRCMQYQFINCPESLFKSGLFQCAICKKGNCAGYCIKKIDRNSCYYQKYFYCSNCVKYNNKQFMMKNRIMIKNATVEN